MWNIACQIAYVTCWLYLKRYTELYKTKQHLMLEFLLWTYLHNRNWLESSITDPLGRNTEICAVITNSDIKIHEPWFFMYRENSNPSDAFLEQKPECYFTTISIPTECLLVLICNHSSQRVWVEFSSKTWHDLHEIFFSLLGVQFWFSSTNPSVIYRDVIGVMHVVSVLVFHRREVR